MKRIRAAVIIIVVVAVISTGIWWFFKSSSSEASPDILTSGFIEATSVSIAPEYGGRITDISAEEGDSVTAGTALVKLDGSLLAAQKEQAEAAVKIAGVTLERAKISQEQAAISAEGARKILDNALDMQANPLELDTRIITAQGEVEIAELNYKHTKELTLPDWWQEQTAKLRLETAQEVLANLEQIKANPQEINTAVDQADTAYKTAEQAVTLAGKAVEMAVIQVEQAEASRKVIDIQIEKLVLYSPVSGVISGSYAEVGEIARQGVPVLTVSVLDKVTLTAYIPESKIGLVKLGQAVNVSVDSYPGEIFPGTVTYISPEAQFTPRNVQLQEEREKMVFPIKIRLDNPEQKLKPGMPADARIISGQ
jgi:HlyD family secretion protein